jgi:hypothetical protein
VPPPGFVPPPGDGVPAPVAQPAPVTPSGRFRPPSVRHLVAAGLGVAAALVAIFLLLGSSSNPAVDPIAQAATVSSDAPGYQMHMSFTLTSSAFSGPITGYGDAVVDPGDHAISSSFAIDYSALPQAAQVFGPTSTMRMDMIESGRVVYLRLPQALLGAIPNLGARPWIKMNLAKLAGVPGLSSLGSDPTSTDPAQVLQYLQAASDGVTNDGQQRVDGVQTTHYHADLDLGRLAAEVPTADQGALEQALTKLRQAAGGTDVPVDVWVDAHQLVRQTAMSFSLHSAGGPSLDETVVADLTDYGPQPRPSLPPADQVQDASSLESSGGLSG